MNPQTKKQLMILGGLWVVLIVVLLLFVFRLGKGGLEPEEEPRVASAPGGAEGGGPATTPPAPATSPPGGDPMAGGGPMAGGDPMAGGYPMAGGDPMAGGPPGPGPMSPPTGGGPSGMAPLAGGPSGMGGPPGAVPGGPPAPGGGVAPSPTPTPVSGAGAPTISAGVPRAKPKPRLPWRDDPFSPVYRPSGAPPAPSVVPLTIPPMPAAISKGPLFAPRMEWTSAPRPDATNTISGRGSLRGRGRLSEEKSPEAVEAPYRMAGILIGGHVNAILETDPTQHGVVRAGDTFGDGIKVLRIERDRLYVEDLDKEVKYVRLKPSERPKEQLPTTAARAPGTVGPAGAGGQPMMPGMQMPGMMGQIGEPGMMPGMQPGMMPGMQPGMMPGMQPGMMPGMQPGMMPGMQAEMMPGMQAEMMPGMPGMGMMPGGPGGPGMGPAGEGGGRRPGIRIRRKRQRE